MRLRSSFCVVAVNPRSRLTRDFYVNVLGWLQSEVGQKAIKRAAEEQLLRYGHIMMSPLFSVRLAKQIPGYSYQVAESGDMDFAPIYDYLIPLLEQWYPRDRVSY